MNIKTTDPFSLTFSSVSTFRSSDRVWFCETAVRQDTTKIFNFFYKIRVSFQRSLLNNKVYQFFTIEILHKNSFRAIIKTSILQLYRTIFSCKWLLPIISDNLFNECDQKIRQVKNQITIHQTPQEKLKQPGLGNCCLVLSNGRSVLCVVSCKSITYYSITLKFSAV